MKLSVLLLLLLSALILRAEDWTTTNGKTYHVVVVVKVLPDSVIISSIEGTAILHFTDLAPAQQKKFGYDPAAIAAAEQKKKDEAAAALKQPFNYTDAVALLDKIGSGKYDRFNDYYTYELSPLSLSGEDGEYKAWITCYSGGDHLCRENNVTVSMERVGEDWLWLKGHDVVMLAGKIKYVPAETRLTSDVLHDGGVFEIVHFDMPVSLLNDMGQQSDWAIQVGITELDLHAVFSMAALDLFALLQPLPREHEPIPAAQPHTAKYNSIIEDDTAKVDSSPTGAVQQPARSDTFNPGSIDTPVTGQ